MPRKGQRLKGKFFNCLFCNKEFWRNNGWLKKTTPKYCSEECRNKGVSKSYKHRDKILEMYTVNKYSITKIDKLLGINSRSSVESIIRLSGIEIRPMSFYMTMEKNPNYKTGRTIEHGYIKLAIGKGKQQFEHRIIMEKLLGRKLLRNEHIHHLNGIKNDNRIENLSVLTSKPHGEYHAKQYNEWKKMYQDRIYALESIINKCICQPDKR